MKLELGPHTVETSNDDKRLFPESGITKARLIDYYRKVAEVMLPHLEERCLTVRRFPDGIGEEGFFQQHRPDHLPDFVGRKSLPTADGKDRIEHIVVDNTAALIALVDQAAIEYHGWQSKTNSPRSPDRLVFDLDPSDDDFDTVIDCARQLKRTLEAVNLVPFVMTTGSRGLHVVAPLADNPGFDAMRRFARAVAAATAAKNPSEFTTEHRKKARGNRLYIDTGRNAYGQTAIVPYSLRAIEGAPVATPLDW
ncbi:MAG: non-homologous end-joining DNA ligase, partial [Woeseiaceae bacterium]|nr:non-homologous end-joining DNA ligase [Woeseiaceae bacterium]